MWTVTGVRRAGKGNMKCCSGWGRLNFQGSQGSLLSKDLQEVKQQDRGIRGRRIFQEPASMGVGGSRAVSRGLSEGRWGVTHTGPQKSLQVQVPPKKPLGGSVCGHSVCSGEK